jgi:hypothetical protein
VANIELTTAATKKPWVLAAIEACEGLYGPLYAGDGERPQAVERRILLEFGGVAERDRSISGPRSGPELCAGLCKLRCCTKGKARG